MGLIDSNARHSGGTVIPHLNFSIPSAALKPVFLYAAGGESLKGESSFDSEFTFFVCCISHSVVSVIFSDTRDVSHLSALSNPSDQLSAVWALVPPPPPTQTKDLPFLGMLPKQESKPNQHGSSTEKGSRFAKFLADKTFELSKKPKAEANSESSKQQLQTGSDALPPVCKHIYYNSRL
jgi:hypothetical protein